MINLGDEVRDEVTGFQGVVLARMECLYEATQIRVHARSLDEVGRMRESVWIEEDRCTVIVASAVVGFVHVAGKEEVPEHAR